jgi:Ca2+-binding RTX toxin-like protein
MHTQNTPLTSATNAADADAVSASGLRPVIVTGDSDNRVDIILLGDGYTDSEIDTTFTSDILDYLSYIFDDSALTQPFGRYENFFNIYAVDVVSNESGADDPTTGIVRDTALDATYLFDGVTQRLLYVNETAATTAMNAALSGTGIAAEMRYVLVNDTQYGGGGGYFAVYAAGNGIARDIALHEVGHSFAGLADEYGGIQQMYLGAEPVEINVTTNPAGEKWAEWLGYVDPVLGTVGAYEGGRYYDFGIYRPTLDSKMNILGQPFDPIAREEFILGFYELVDPLDGYDDNAGTRHDVQSLSVDAIDPAVIHIDWTVNGQTFADAGEIFNFAAHGLGPGEYTVTARAYDPTDWVRGDRSELEQTVTWTVDNLDQNLAPVITSNGGNDTAGLAVPENSSFVTTVTALDPDQTTPTYSLSGGADQFRFTIDAVTGVLSFTEAPDFEAPKDSDFDNSYIVEVEATDGTLSDFQTLSVNVTDVVGAKIIGTAAEDFIDALTTVPGQPLPTDEDDTIVGAGGKDFIQALGGDDTVYGGVGRDKVDGGLGADVMYGGPRDDTYTVDNPDDRVIENHHGGADRVKSSVSFTLGENVENLTLTGSDNTDGTGNGSANAVTGNASNNVLSGEGGKDTLRGKAGDDILIGGEGFDIYAGGPGADQFVFDSPSRTSADSVIDFSSAQGDRLAVYGADYGLDAGLLADASYFALASSALADVDHGRFLYKAASRTLSWDADGSVGTPNTVIATFDTAAKLSESDFLVL